MVKFLLLFLVVIVAIIFHNNKFKIKWETFLKRGFAPKRGKFGVYCYCGKQGQGKTYSAVEYLLQNKDKRIYSNVRTLQGVKYTPIGDFDDLLALRSETDCIIFYDEIFTALSKKNSSKLGLEKTNQVMEFLSQMRKRRIIFITTAQEWLEIDMTMRRYCRYQIDCRMINFFGLGILIKTFHDAESMKWSQLENEYVAPLLETSISKCNLEVANSYDTFEQISSSNKSKH